MTRSTRPSLVALVGLVAFSVVGCPGTKQPGGGGAPPTFVYLSTTEHDSVVVQADSLYDFEQERESLGDTDSGFPGPVVADGSIPHMTIATARLKSGVPRPSHRIIARIRSDADYPPMGIKAGWNFVWRDSWNDAEAASWKTRIVPRKSTTAHDLTRDSRLLEYMHGVDPKEPRLIVLKVHSVGLGLCLDDPSCPTGHCGYY